MSKALICIDFIEEMVGASGKLAGKGYRAFCEKHSTIANLAKRQEEIRREGGRVVHVHLGFAPDYADHPARSKLLAGARAGGILKLGTQSTTIVDGVAPVGDDIVIVKKRISAFHGTSLELALRSLGVTDIIIAGVATDLAVQSAARDAHDRDFGVEIAADACAAASDDDHDSALKTMAKFAGII
jgi:nicotinamidase-related amidase